MKRGVYDGSKMKNFKLFYGDFQNVKELVRKGIIIFFRHKGKHKLEK